MSVKTITTARLALFAAMAAVLSTALFSCGGGNAERDEQQAVRLSPLETVRRLAEENAAYVEPEPAGIMPLAPEFKAIRERGRVVFAMVAHDQKPFFYRDEQTGELIGLDVEIGYAIANRLRVKAVFNREATTFDGVVATVSAGDADIALSKLSVTTRRSESVRFTVPYMVFRQALLVNRLEFAKIGPEESLPRFMKRYRGTIGVLGNTSYENFARINFPEATVVPFKSWNEVVDALFRGDILSIYRDESEIHIVNKTRKDASIMMKQVVIRDERDPIAMAVSADASMLQNWLNVFLGEYISQNSSELTPSRLIERHFNSDM